VSIENWDVVDELIFTFAIIEFSFLESGNS
jgi:hypothetical protein